MNQKAKDLFKILFIYIVALLIAVATAIYCPSENALIRVAIADVSGNHCGIYIQRYL